MPSATKQPEKGKKKTKFSDASDKPFIVFFYLLKKNETNKYEKKLWWVTDQLMVVADTSNGHLLEIYKKKNKCGTDKRMLFLKKWFLN